MKIFVCFIGSLFIFSCIDGAKNLQDAPLPEAPESPEKRAPVSVNALLSKVDALSSHSKPGPLFLELIADSKSSITDAGSAEMLLNTPIKGSYYLNLFSRHIKKMQSTIELKNFGQTSLLTNEIVRILALLPADKASRYLNRVVDGNSFFGTLLDAHFDFNELILSLSDKYSIAYNDLSPARLNNYFFLLGDSKKTSHKTRIAEIDNKLTNTKIKEFIDWAVIPKVEVKSDWVIKGGSAEYWWNKMHWLYDNVSELRKKELRKEWLTAALKAAKRAVLMPGISAHDVAKLPTTHVLLDPFGFNHYLSANDLVTGNNNKDINLITFMVDSLKGAPLKDTRVQAVVWNVANQARRQKTNAEWQSIAQDALSILAGPEGVNNRAEARKILGFDK